VAAAALGGGAVSTGRCESWTEGIRMPRYAPNKMPTALKRRYFELIRTGLSGSAAAQEVGVSLSCGSLWFIDAGRVSLIETAISSRYLSQDDRIEIADGLAQGEPVKLARHWSPAQISRWLRRRHRRRRSWHVCTETIYEAVYRGLIVPVDRQSLRTGRTYRHRRGRGRTRDGALKQSTAMKSIHQRPPSVASRRQAGHWESQCCCQAA
jgi:transposase, IS30 family